MAKVKVDLLKLLRECSADMKADGIYDMGDDSVAYDMAGCLLEDPDNLAAAKALWPGKDRDLLQEMIADRL